MDFLLLRTGKKFLEDETVALLPLNPYDPADHNNPQEFHWPFMLNGRAVFEGSELHSISFGMVSEVVELYLEEGKKWCSLKLCPDKELTSENFCWPDELPAKKKVAKWAYCWGWAGDEAHISFTEEEMTAEEAREKHGTSVRMIPGTEREVGA